MCKKEERHGTQEEHHGTQENQRTVKIKMENLGTLQHLGTPQHSPSSLMVPYAPKFMGGIWVVFLSYRCKDASSFKLTTASEAGSLL